MSKTNATEQTSEKQQSQVITVKLLKSEAWAIIRATESETSDASPLEWAKNRIFRMLVEAGLAEYPVPNESEKT